MVGVQLEEFLLWLNQSSLHTYFHSLPNDLLSSEFCRCGYCFDMTRRAAWAQTINAFMGRFMCSFFRSEGALWNENTNKRPMSELSMQLNEINKEKENEGEWTQRNPAHPSVDHFSLDINYKKKGVATLCQPPAMRNSRIMSNWKLQLKLLFVRGAAAQSNSSFCRRLKKLQDCTQNFILP